MSAQLQPPDARHLDLHLHIPTRTVVKVLATLVLVWAGLRLWPEFVLLLISLLLAVALHPAITALERRGLGRGLVVSLLTLVLVGLTVLLVTFIVMVGVPLWACKRFLHRRFDGPRDEGEVKSRHIHTVLAVSKCVMGSNDLE